MKKLILLSIVGLFILSCDFVDKPKISDDNLVFNLSYRASIELEQKNFLPGKIMKVICSGLDAQKEYKVARFFLDGGGDEVGMPRYIKDNESKTLRFRVLRQLGKYRIKIIDMETDSVVARKNYFTVESLDPEPPIDPPDPPVDPPVTSHTFSFEVMTDKYTVEDQNSWKLFSQSGTVIASGPDVPYANNTSYWHEVKLDNGNYRLEFYDNSTDGLTSGGYVKAFIDGQFIFRGASYRWDNPDNPYKLGPMGKKAILKFRVGPGNYALTTREQEYLDEHNKHRKIAHEAEGLKYVPLRWNEAVAKEAQRWADYLVRDGKCDLVHEQQGLMGENLAARTGTADPRPVSSVVQSWVNSPGHYSQLKWRGSHYLGCGEAYGDNCSVQACRFVTFGNCNGYDNWIEDYTPCSSMCPPEGCYIEN